MVLAALALLGVIRPRRRHAPGRQSVTPQLPTIACHAQRAFSSSVPDDQSRAVMMAAGCMCGKMAR
jgi:hypothetical protein